MKCTSKKAVKEICLCLALSLLLSGCGGLKYDFAFDSKQGISSFSICYHLHQMKADSFARGLCVADTDKKLPGIETAGAYGLFDVERSSVLYAKDVHEQMNPASLTKIMTAVVALKEGTMDQVLTASENVKITEKGAQVSGIKKGDSMTLDQAMHLLLINSSNDVAVLIAEGVGGSVPEFVDMMNAEAKKIGATNSHFLNPHGLTEEGHYTTAYDMYLIFNEAMKYDDFMQIMHMDSYETVYHNAKGEEQSVSVKTTNLYLRKELEAPDNITVIGGKTGTTNAAGHCLVLLNRDISGKSYISIILGEPSKDKLYEDMLMLQKQI